MHWLVEIVLNTITETPATIRDLCAWTNMDPRTMSWAVVMLEEGGKAERDVIGRICTSQ